MIGFREITGIASFDSLIATDQYGGVAGNVYGNELFIVFRGRDNTGKLVNVDSGKILTAFGEGCIRIINYLGSGSYTVSLTESNPEECDFILKESFSYKNSLYHVIHFAIGSLNVNSAVSVAIDMGDNVHYSTSFVTDEDPRIIPPSFAII